MRMLLGILGVLACGLSVLPMLGQTILPQLMTPFAAQFCQPGERLAGEVFVTERETGSSVGTTFVCVDDAGNERSVRGQIVRQATSLFLLLMFGGFALMVVGGTGMVKPGDAEPESQPTPLPGPTTSGLAARLQELDDARRKGLLTEAEYQQMRQKALDRWG